jgi:hypothetical protein
MVKRYRMGGLDAVATAVTYMVSSSGPGSSLWDHAISTKMRSAITSTG